MAENSLIPLAIDLRIAEEKKRLHRRIDQLGNSMFMNLEVRKFTEFAHKFRCDIKTDEGYNTLMTASNYVNSLLKITGIQYVEYFGSPEMNKLTFILTCVNYKSNFLISELIYDIDQFISMRKSYALYHKIIVSLIRTEYLVLNVLLHR